MAKFKKSVCVSASTDETTLSDSVIDTNFESTATVANTTGLEIKTPFNTGLTENQAIIDKHSCGGGAPSPFATINGLEIVFDPNIIPINLETLKSLPDPSTKEQLQELIETIEDMSHDELAKLDSLTLETDVYMILGDIRIKSDKIK